MIVYNSTSSPVLNREHILNDCGIVIRLELLKPLPGPGSAIFQAIQFLELLRRSGGSHLSAVLYHWWTRSVGVIDCTLGNLKVHSATLRDIHFSVVEWVLEATGSGVLKILI